jgi:hypothetical protein
VTARTSSELPFGRLAQAFSAFLFRSQEYLRSGSFRGVEGPLPSQNSIPSTRVQIQVRRVAQALAATRLCVLSWTCSSMRLKILSLR